VALIRVGVVDDSGALRPLPLLNDSSALPQATRPQEAMAPEPKHSGLVEIELPNRIKVRVDAGIEEGALRRVLAAVHPLA
jgi:hypothetical protein